MPSAVETNELSHQQRMILGRCRYLPERDAALVRSHFEGRVPMHQIALMLGQHPGALYRRLKRLLERLSDPSVVLLTDRLRFLPPELRQIGIEYYLHDLKMRELCERHQLSDYQVRNMLRELRGCLRAARFGE